MHQDYAKANELWLRAGELGFATAYHNLANSYLNGEGVDEDIKEAEKHWELAAMGGDAKARYNLGAWEKRAGNISRAMKHWMIAAWAGCDGSLKHIRVGFFKGHVTKDDFETTSRAHKEATDEVKSDQRDIAAAYDEALARN